MFQIGSARAARSVPEERLASGRFRSVMLTYFGHSVMKPGGSTNERCAKVSPGLREGLQPRFHGRTKSYRVLLREAKT